MALSVVMINSDLLLKVISQPDYVSSLLMRAGNMIQTKLIDIDP